MSEIVFEENETDGVKKLVTYSYFRHDWSQSLLVMLKKRNAITLDDTFTTVKNNVHLMSAITASITYVGSGGRGQKQVRPQYRVRL